MSKHKERSLGRGTQARKSDISNNIIGMRDNKDIVSDFILNISLIYPNFIMSLYLIYDFFMINLCVTGYKLQVTGDRVPIFLIGIQGEAYARAGCPIVWRVVT